MFKLCLYVLVQTELTYVSLYFVLSLRRVILPFVEMWNVVLFML
jgi:hypothetical protein